MRSAIHRIRPPAPKPMILLYHRVADERVDPWSLSVSPGHFEEQLDIIRRVRRPMPLAQFVGALVDGSLPANAIVLTFDDGYVDNLVCAKPLLVAADVPATVFLATGYTGRFEPFWWDELATLILCEKRSGSFDFRAGNHTISCSFDDDPIGGEYSGALELSKQRRAALWTIWQTLRYLDDEDRRSAMLKLRLICLDDRVQGRDIGRAMSREEVRSLTSDGLVTLGAHTVTHPVLAGLESEACRREIKDSKLTCEAIINAPIAAFAYPYGAFDTAAREAVASAGFSIGCSVQRGPASARSDLFALPRTGVLDLGGDEFERALREN